MCISFLFKACGCFSLFSDLTLPAFLLCQLSISASEFDFSLLFIARCPLAPVIQWHCCYINLCLCLSCSVAVIIITLTFNFRLVEYPVFTCFCWPVFSTVSDINIRKCLSLSFFFPTLFVISSKMSQCNLCSPTLDFPLTSALNNLDWC